MGQLVQSQLDRTLEALASFDTTLADEVIVRDDQIDRAYVEVEQEILRTLALQAPVAKDLRLVAGVLHINSHIERMGDLCVNMAKFVRITKDYPPVPEIQATLVEMGGHAQRMVAAAMTCFARRDLELAERLPILDQPLDRLNSRGLPPDRAGRGRRPHPGVGQPHGAGRPLPGAARRPLGRHWRAGGLHRHRRGQGARPLQGGPGRGRGQLAHLGAIDDRALLPDRDGSAAVLGVVARLAARAATGGRGPARPSAPAGRPFPLALDRAGRPARADQRAGAITTRLRDRLEELTEERDRAGQIVDALDDGVLLLDGAGRLLVANPAARSWFGLPTTCGPGSRSSGCSGCPRSAPWPSRPPRPGRRLWAT
jgi:hypothetical protein